MSCFVLSPNHISVMACAFEKLFDIQNPTHSWYSADIVFTPSFQNAPNNLVREFHTAQHIAEELMRTNIASVCARYGQIGAEELQSYNDYIELCKAITQAHRQYADQICGWLYDRPSYEVLVQMIDSFEYQSCEVQGYNKSLAYRLCAKAKDIMLAYYTTRGRNLTYAWDLDIDRMNKTQEEPILIRIL
jgi:hypothetical protein